MNSSDTNFTEYLSTLDCEDWESLKPAFASFLDKPVESSEDLEKMVRDWSLLIAYVQDTQSEIHNHAALDTLDVNAQKRKTEFTKNIDPELELSRNAFEERVLELAATYPLPERYETMLKILASDKKIFHAANPRLNAEANTLAQEYDSLMGALAIEVNGKKYAPPQINGLLAKAERGEREVIWKSIWNERKKVADTLEGILGKQIALRHEMSDNAGFSNFRDYTFQLYRRFSYTPGDAKTLHSSIEKYIVPVSRKLYRQHAKQLGVESLKPWDISVSRLHEVVVRPYAEKSTPKITNAQIEKFSEDILRGIDGEMLGLFQEMKRRHEMDLDAKAGKAPGAYQTAFPYRKRPYIFCNNAESVQDLYTTLHEFGHAFHYAKFADEPVHIYRELPMESAELASMSCELIGHRNFEICFTKEESEGCRARAYEAITFFLCYMAQVDAFQHWLYENPKHETQERREKWSELTDRFGPEIDWTGIEDYKRIYWHQQIHIFRHPFYYIEYGIAQLGALQVERNYMADREQGLKNWKYALSLGASKPLGEVYEAAGIRFNFSEKTVKPVGEMLERMTG